MRRAICEQEHPPPQLRFEDGCLVGCLRAWGLEGWGFGLGLGLGLGLALGLGLLCGLG